MLGVLIGVDASRVTRARLTGTETYSLQVLRALLPLDQRNDYRLYLSQPLSRDLLPARDRVDRRVIRMPRLWTHLGLSREMLRAPCDVLFVPSHVIPLVHPRRTVVVVYDVGHRFFPQAHRLAERVYLEAAIRWHVRVATQIVTISADTRRDLVRLFGADPRRVSVAYPAVDGHFRPPPAAAVAEVRRRYGLPERYVLHVGTLKPRKNVPRLVRAFAAAELPPDVGLVLAGMATHGAADLREALDASGVRQRVQTLAYVDLADLPALYGGATCTAVVSLHEGFGMPALEALACGAPTVVSDRGSLPEVVQSAGLLVDPFSVPSIAAGLTRLVTDGALAGRLRGAGLARARAFTWDGAAAVTLAALDRAGSGTGPPPSPPAGRTPAPSGRRSDAR